MTTNNGTHVWKKDGVMGRMSRPLRKAWGRVVHKCYWDKGRDAFVTSIEEGNHDPGSLHYDRGAIDFKRNGAHIYEVKKAAGIGKGFDVIEYVKMDIFHMEYDPK